MDEITKQQIRDTLAREDVNYNIAACADLLGLPVTTVHSFIDRNPELAARCPNKNAERLVPRDMDILDRAPPGEGMLPKEQAAMMKEMMKTNDRIIKKGWRDVGLSDEDAMLMEEAEKRASMPIGRVLAASEGGLMSLLVRSTRMLDKIGDQLANKNSKHGPLPKITDVAGSDKTEVEYFKVFQSGVMVHVNIQQTLLKTRAATIDAMAKLKAMAEQAKQPEKGVFETTPNAAPNNQRGS